MTIVNDGWIKTTCAYCGVGCGVEARAKSCGELEIRGDKSHPSNYGKLCTKGIALGDTVIHDGRLLAPIDKTFEKNSNTCVEYMTPPDRNIDWDEATSIVASKFSETIERYGPDSVAFYVSGQLLTEDYYVANKLIKGFIGSSNIDSNSRLCMASSVVGHKRAFGADTVPVCYQDLDEADLVILVGSNLAWCHPVLFQRLRLAQQENSKLQIVVIDPRQTDTCSIADEHLAIKSGADVALFNGLLNYLVSEDCVDKAFINDHTNGFEQAMISAQSERNIEATTGLTSQQLTSFYQGFANSEKVLTIYSQGVNQSTSGSDKVNAIVNCHLATGKIGKVGSGPFSVTGQPNAMGGREVGALANTLAAHMEFDNPNHIESIKRFWQSDNLSTKPGLKAIDMFDALKDGKIKAIWIMATNPVVSLPDSEKIKSALRDCPFVVVSDCIADTETTRFADMVLPAQGWSEKSGTVTNSERRISRQRRLMPSPGLAKPDWWIISQVAKKMGFTQAFDYRHEGEIFREYAQLTTQDNHNGERDLNLIGLTQLDDKGYSQLSPQQWPVTSLQDDIVDQRMFTDGQFFTANKRANFVAVEHQLPKSDTSETYPLLLNTGRSRDHWHTMTRTGLSARLAEHKPEPFMLIHPTIAKRFTIDQGQIAKVMNAQGECQARVEISDEVSSEQVFVAIHWNNLTAKNSKPCDLIAPHTDAFSGQPEFKHTPVTLAACHYQSRAIFLTKQPLDLNECDYWSRQKVAGGYLYRIESALSVYQLTQILKQKFIGNSEKLLTVETGTQHRLATIKQDQLSQLAIVQPSVDGWELDQWIESFTQPFLLEQEQLFLAKQCA
ncbi:nitrate reductase [Vibrio sp. TH_r3]|uniref:molybdopterin oxidoreductase family protein n=1 Tax=Vibrio sp. TH_r3 TaxID=3082084 RepID=UPI0029547E10|nr:nitrate reductase [Vibrio sp. TH_r3]MDV7104003.1 nitrate reductase [Vibrio sp. TH_r3]